MKNAIIFFLFLAFMSCKNAVPSSEPVATNQADAPKPKEFTEPTVMVEMPYTKVKKGQIIQLSKVLARYQIENDKAAQTDSENKDYFDTQECFNAETEQIREYTFYKDYTLSFEQFDGQIYMHYNGKYLVHAIPLSLVQTYIE